jgi:hypothetical protein
MVKISLSALPLAALLSSSPASALTLSSDDYVPSVEIKNGTYTGTHDSLYNIDSYVGIPYALPPVGDLRFRVPQSLNTSWTEPRNATVFSPFCVGYGVRTSVSLPHGSRMTD